jgi:uncharacterized protein YceH (UPF0502 family)
MFEQLTAEEARVLGALIEKELTTPDYYPLTANALRNACNQKSNRNPVVAYDESTILRAIDGLRDKGLGNRVHAADARVPKYEHKFGTALALSEQEIAVLCELMLRGPQTVGELRGRCDRLYPFSALDEVHVTLETLMDCEPPKVMRLPVQPGRKEPRYAQLLTGEPDPEMLEVAPVAAAKPAVASVDESRIETLETQVATLQEEIESLKAAFETFRQQFE